MRDLPPVPINPLKEEYIWRDWFYFLRKAALAVTSFLELDFKGSNITSIESRNHNDLTLLQGGATDEYYHLPLGIYNRVISHFNYGEFINSASQSFPIANESNTLVLSNVLSSNGLILDTNKIIFSSSGTYNVQFSLQLNNTSTSANEFYVWLSLNDIDIDNTGSKITVHPKHGTIDGYSLATVSFLIDVVANDYLELKGAVTDVSIGLEAYTSSTSPFNMPSIPSTVVVISKVS